MKLLILIALVATASAVQFRQNVIHKPAMNLKGAAIVDYVNNLKTTWHAEYNEITHRNLMNVKYTKHPQGVMYSEAPEITADIPDSFDSRQQWSNCKSIAKIRDQSQCGSCWAFAAAESLTDRICIASNGQQTPELSAEDLLECCGFFCGFGCEGGYPIRAWNYMASTGLVTGGGFYEQTGCKPYSASEPCGHHTVNGVAHYHNCTGEAEATTPSCSSSCTNSAYTTPYKQDKHFAKSGYAVKESVKAIQTEILANGPVEAAFTVYEDFDHYKGGVYQHQTGSVLGGHAVKILGWGTDNGTPYWIVANSWNTNWGEQGFFRIIRGVNECGIEEAIVAGLAKV